MSIVCVSCKKKVTNKEGTVKFNCPNCSGYEFVRCKNCRVIATKFKCPKCGFEGPN